MAIGCPQAVTSHDVAAPAAADASRQGTPMQLSCQISADGHAVVTMRGELDLATADRVVRYVSDVIDRSDGPVIADLHALAFCDACGLGALIRIAAHAEQAGRPLELARPSPAVTKIMRITGVEHRLLAPSRAVQGAGAPAPAAERG